MNAIISAAVGMTMSQLDPFVASLSRHAPGSVVYLIVRSKDCDSLRSLRKHSRISIEFVPIQSRLFQNEYARAALRACLKPMTVSAPGHIEFLQKPVVTYCMHIALRRYLDASAILEKRTDMKNVLLCDSRDVFFQGDPFEFIQNKVICGLESISIRECVSNSNWIRHLYGIETLDLLGSNRIICSGVTIGPYPLIRKYLSLMSRACWDLLPRIAFSCGYDQGIHNKLIYGNLDSGDYQLVENGDGLIATIGHEGMDCIKLDYFKKLIKVHGRAAPVVHQYDRHPAVKDFVLGLRDW